MSKATETEQELPQVIQLGMTAHEFAVVSIGLALLMAARMDDKGRLLEGVMIAQALQDEFADALDTLAKKIKAGWHHLPMEEA